MAEQYHGSVALGGAREVIPSVEIDDLDSYEWKGSVLSGWRPAPTWKPENAPVTLLEGARVGQSARADVEFDTSPHLLGTTPFT